MISTARRMHIAVTIVFGSLSLLVASPRLCEAFATGAQRPGVHWETSPSHVVLWSSTDTEVASETETLDDTDASTSTSPSKPKPKSKPPTPIVLASLESNQFRHPLDQRLTSLVQRAPFYELAEETLRRAFPLIEEGVRLDLMASSVKVSPQQLPELHDLLTEACDVLNFPSTFVPELYIQSNPQANAYTLALQSRNNKNSNSKQQDDNIGDRPSSSVIVVTSALVDRCTPRELQAVLGHELGHLKCEHALYLTLGNLAFGSSPLGRLPVLGSRIESTLRDWRLAAEYSCDRAALLVAQDSEVAASALVKLFAGTARYELSTRAFIDQSLEYEKQLETANPLVRMSIQRQQRTHPLPVKRVAELEKWFRSDEYRKIVRQ